MQSFLSATNEAPSISPHLTRAKRYEESISLQSTTTTSIEERAKELLEIDTTPDDNPTTVSLKHLRALALSSAESKITDLPADKLIAAASEITKTINLITGKPTENVSMRAGLFIVSEEQTKKIRDIFA